MVRYHFNRKFFIQLEAQFNSPQYTGKNLLISLPPLDSLSPTVRRQSSVLIKKLFYFNVPLSVHYRVFKNLDVGAGIQFSRLSNGIGLFQDRTINIGPGGAPDSLSAVSKSFKGDTLYKKIKTTELRALLDASYTQGKFIFGVRYNQALSQFRAHGHLLRSMHGPQVLLHLVEDTAAGRLGHNTALRAAVHEVHLDLIPTATGHNDAQRQG